MPVKFVFWDRINRLRAELFKRWICDNPDLREFIMSSLLIRNNKVLLVGLPGSGKSTLVRLIAKALSRKGDNNECCLIFGMTIGAPEKTLQKVLMSTNIVKLLTTGEEEIIVRPIVKARIKFINEINRFSKSVQDALLSLLEEGYLEYGGTIFRTPEYICFADMNPFRGDIDRALKARFLGSCYIDIPSIYESKKILDGLLNSEMQHREYPDLVKTMPQIMSIEELERVWDDVAQVHIPEIVKLFTLMLVAAFRVCKYRRSMVGYMRLKCADCEYSNEPCSFVQEPPDERANIALLFYARARAWLYRRARVSFDDVIWAAPYVLAHRLEIKPLVKSRSPNPWELIRRTIRDIVSTKWVSDGEAGIWAKALALVCKILDIEPIAPLEEVFREYSDEEKLVALQKLERLAYGEFGRGDLVLQQVYFYVKNQLQEHLKDTRIRLLGILNELLSKPDVTLSELESFRECLRKYPSEIVGDIIDKLLVKMEEYKVAFNLEAPVNISEFMMVLAQHGIPQEIITNMLDRTQSKNISYTSSLLRIKRLGKNIIIMTETKELADELRRSLWS